jgi:hypothetical protein
MKQNSETLAIQLRQDSLARLRQEIHAAVHLAESAVQRALYCGCLLIREKEEGGHGNFLAWIEENLPEISVRTAQRWMECAQRAIADSGVAKALPESIDIEEVFSTQDGQKLPEAAREGHQLLLDFMSNKTLKDILTGVVVDGDAPHRLSRAAGGMQKGGAGGDRKAFDEFITRDLASIASHLDHKLTAGQQARIASAFDTATQAWPRWLLDVVADALARERKLSDIQRNGRSA